MRLTLFLIISLVAVSMCGAAPISTTNLLTNPGAELGNLTGWTASAAPGASGAPEVDNGTAPAGIQPHNGSYDFYGDDSGAFGDLYQSISLVGTQGITAADIDTGNLLATASYWEQGLDEGSVFNDHAEISLEFYNGITNFTHIVSVDSHNGSWQQGTGTFTIPAGTRSINYTIAFFRNENAAIDAFVDDNSLTIVSPSISAVPEPSTFGLLFAGFLGAGLLLKRRKAMR